jgi:DNA (cytosine-5)-methyltransferase 1
VVTDEYDADENHAFACLLSGLSELGYGVAFRSLDAQYAGLAQRRERVFVVGYLGDVGELPLSSVQDIERLSNVPCGVLFERYSMHGHHPPRRKTREDVTETIGSGTDISHPEITQCLTTGTGQRFDPETETLLPVAFNWQSGGSQMRVGYEPESAVTSALSVGQTPAVHLDVCSWVGDATPKGSVGVAGTLCADQGGEGQGVSDANGVRRLTPVETARLQGFPDDWARIPWRGNPADECPDGPQYKAYGNSMAVPCMRWIGERIQMVDNLLKRNGDVE